MMEINFERSEETGTMINTSSGILQPIPPFDFSQSLDFLGLFPPTQREQSLTGQTLTKAVSLAGQVVVFQVKSLGSIEKPELTYTLWSEQPLTPSAEQATQDRLRFFLSLDDDLRPFYAIGQSDPYFAPVITRLYGYHQVKFLTPFENTCWAVLTQRTPLDLAKKMKQALMTRYGGSLTVDDATYWAFPEATHLAQADEADLAVLLHHARRAEYIGTAARAFAAVDETFLRSGPYDEVRAWLRSIKGIGDWSADFILLRGLGRMDSLPLTEKRLLAVVAKVYNQGQLLSDQRVRELADKYGSCRGYWAHYLRVSGGD